MLKNALGLNTVSSILSGLYSRILKLFPTVSSLAPASTRPVQQGQVCEFDGVNDRVDLGAISLGIDESTAYIECTFKGVTAGNNYLVAPSTGGSSASCFFGLKVAGNKLTVNLGDGASYELLSSTTVLNSTTWYTVRVEIIAGFVRFTINGSVEDIARTIVPAYQNNNWGIGVFGTSGILVFNGSIAHVKIGDATTNYGQYNLNHASGTTAYDSSGNGNDGTLQNGAAFVVDNTLPPEADRLNLEGFSKATVLSASSSRVRFNTGVIPTFEASKIRVGWYQPYEITSATSVGTLCALNTTNGAMNIKIGSSTSLATNETLTFSGNSSSRTYTKDVIPAGYHVVEIVSTGSTTWDIYLDDALMTKYTYSASTEKTVNQVWVGPSSNGSDGVAGAVFQEFKIWDDSDVLQVDVDMENSANTNLVGGESPSTDSGSVVIIPRDESDSENDIFGNPLQYSGSVYPRRPEFRNSYAASFDGVDDRLDCSTNALARKGNVVEFKVKVDYQVNQTTSIIASNHSSNNSTCYAPHLRLVHNTNQIIFYGCRGAPFPYWNIDSSFYGVWHTIKLRMHNTDATLIYLSIDGGDEVSIAANITTIPGNWGNDRNTYWAFGTGKNMELSDVKIFTTESDYNSNNPIIHHPLTEGAGDTVYDASGNGNHGTINNASTGTEGVGFWAGRIDGEANALNNNNGFSKRMLFDGVDDEVTMAGITNEPLYDIEVGFFTPVDITAATTAKALMNFDTSGSTFADIGFGNVTGSISNEVVTLFSTSYRIGVTNITIDAGYHTVRFKWDGVSTYLAYIDGILQTTTASGTPAVVNMPVFQVGGARTYYGLFSGVISNITLRDASGVVTSQWNGYGNTDADWTDQVGSNDGTVNGSPALLRIPADTSDPTKDALGDTLTNPAIADGYNGAETELDAYNIAEGDNPSPATNNNSALESIEFGADFASNDAAYMRLKSSTENDRLITFEDDLTGGDKTLAEKFTETP